VYIDADGVIYDATLNQTDVIKNVRPPSAVIDYLRTINITIFRQPLPLLGGLTVTAAL
jgi:hypothetical protein